jgi:peptidoglycan/xylan/chitin deacetylase (PgdA/CDA1 family)
MLMAVCLGRAAPAPGDVISPFTLRTQDGTPWSWHAGRTTVLTFCALWCDTWKVELPRIQQVRNAVRGLPVDFSTVVVDGRWSDRTHTDQGGKLLLDPSGAWSQKLGIDRVPYTLVLSPEGRVTWAAFGTIRSQDLLDAVLNSKTSVAGGPIYLTFDDFPSPTGCYELLDLLRAHRVSATFFCIGDHLDEHPEIARRAVREGHRLEIHSWAHDGLNPQLARCAEAIEKLTAEKATLYRPPGSEKILGLNGASVHYSVDDPYDYARPSPDEIVRRVVLAIHAGSVIQLHCGVHETLLALPRIIENLRERGFTFELLKGKP